MIVACVCALPLSCGFAVSGGTSGTGYSQGPIDAFGSIWVGDVRWDVSKAEIELDGVLGDEDLLDLGMVVTVEGELDASGLQGVAAWVSFDDSVEGVILDDPEIVEPGVLRRLHVMGFDVLIHATDTVFADGDDLDDLPDSFLFATLAEDDMIEVSGLVDGETIYATWVDYVGPYVEGESAAELRGLVEGLTDDGETGEFTIDGITVRWSASTEFEDFDGMSIVEGMLVEATGVLAAVDELDADEIELETEGLGFEDADEVDITGIVSGFTDVDTLFTVAGVTVDASMATIVGVIANGIEVEVEGPLVGGVLEAEEVEVESGS